MLASNLQPETTYLYTGSVEIKVKFIKKTTKGNYEFVATEGAYKGIRRPLSEVAVNNFIQQLS